MKINIFCIMLAIASLCFKINVNASSEHPLLVEAQRFRSNNSIKDMNKSLMEKSILLQARHGIPSNQARILTNTAAEELGAAFVSASPGDKILLMQSLVTKYGNRTPNVIRQLLDQNSMPKEYQFLTEFNTNIEFIEDAISALTDSTVYENQNPSLKTKINNALRPLEATASSNTLIAAFKISLGIDYPVILDKINTTSEIKLRALITSHYAAANYNTLELINAIHKITRNTVNFYRRVGLTEDEALNRSINSITDQYDMISYNGNIIRLPSHKVNLNKVIYLLNNTPILIAKIEWSIPQLNINREKTTADDIKNYFKKYILKGHWATDPINTGLVWINANGVADRMKNKKLLYISFSTINKMSNKELEIFLLTSAKANPPYSTIKPIVNSGIGWMNIQVQDKRTTPYSLK